ncbi:MAG TPA: hypothetical protein VFH61_03390, partial [Thermoleophilia bacterium]|nr:hypothetical protein [Thermoleophilia bacterium]
MIPDVTTVDDVARTAGLAGAPEPMKDVTPFGAFVRGQYDKARQERMPVEKIMLEDLRQRRSKYPDAKLAAIQDIMGKSVEPPFIGITESLCEAIYGWMVDGILPPGQPPFMVDPTPMPELPEFVQAELEQRVEAKLLAWGQAMLQSGQVVDPMALQQQYNEMRELASKQLDQLIMKEARESAKKMFRRIHDLFAEANWDMALRRSMKDLIDCGTGIMRGPVLKEVAVRRSQLSQTTRRYETTYAHDTIPSVERLVPLRFYPSPDATRESMPWYVYVNSMTRKDLATCLSDDSYDTKAVAAALRDYGTSGHREVSAVETEKAALENRLGANTNTELIDRLEYWGSVSGRLLTDFGIEGLIPEQEYGAMVWVVGAHVIKVLINPDPVGLNYVFSAGFCEQPDSFWGISVPRKMRHSQNIANVAARQIVMNMALASGPMMEVNIDRIWPGENFAMRPFLTMRSTNAMMQEGKAVNFYQPQMVTRQLVEVFNFCMQLADHETGIPRLLYAGETGVETAAATSMLMSQAAKGGQNVIRNIDTGLIIPCVQAFFNFIMQYDEGSTEYFGDMKIIPRGSNSMVAKEQKVLRLKEILRDANNPSDLQVITIPIRAKLWKE